MAVGQRAREREREIDRSELFPDLKFYQIWKRSGREGEMVELCLMASSTYPIGVFRQEQRLYRTCKEFRTFTPSPETRQEILRSDGLYLRPHHLEDPLKPMGWLSDSKQSVKLDSAIRKPVLIDVQDSRPDSVLFSYGIAEQCTRHEKIWQFFQSGSSEAEREGIDFSLLSDFTGLQTLAIRMRPQPVVPLNNEACFYEVGTDESQPSLIYPRSKFYAPNPLLDFVGDLSCSSRIIMHPDGRVLFTGSGVEMKDLLSIIAEFYLSMNSTKRGKQPILVPHFTRLDMSEARANVCESSLKLEAVMVAPVKSPKKTKLKQSPTKKNSRKAGRERDLHRRNYLHACESLLSLILGRRQGKTAILSLKKSGPELPQLLTQFSASIAGTGLAVLFSVVCKVAGGRVPFCTSKLLNTGFGFGLVWLSWAVNKLRDSIIYISKNQNKLGLKEEEMMRKVDRSVNEIFFRAATLMAVAVLKIA
ncbi:hypothetical protein BVC80_441g313 [Macleaya cordata]|uniref:Uncharacterized protein n=1 Tax=Macleaya cordata TaxID=56857 RepID=A0A200Q4W2_MACCD|nr:hypothetical protein BVC80_441g313 [Macleaya cordata]